MKKRILSMILAVLMLVSLLPTGAFAIDFGADEQTKANTPEENLEELKQEELSEAPELLGAAPDGTAITGTTTLANGKYYLSADVNGQITVPSGVTATLDLNGHVLNGTGIEGDNASVIRVTGKLTVTDSNTGNLTHYFTVQDGGLWKWDDTKTANAKDAQAITAVPEAGDVYCVTGGVITGGKGTMSGASMYGGGIYIDQNAELILNGGSIAGNTATYGGGVYNKKGDFTMKGGSIDGNTSSIGGGVYNSATASAGCTFIMEGGSIKGNTARSTNEYGGGGVYNSSNSFTMKGGSITGNTAGKFGGGVYNYAGSLNDASFTMKGGSIEGNTATYGGGVYNYATASKTYTFVMEGGSIEGNTAGTSGGGVYNTVNVNSTKPSVCNVTMKGGSITGNTLTDNDNTHSNLYLYSGKTVTLGEGFTGTAGITMEAGKGAFTSNGASTDVQYFTSDNPAYKVKFVEAVGTSGQEGYAAAHLELAKKPVCKNTRTATEYETIAAALSDNDNLNAGDTIQLLEDTAEQVEVAQGQNIILDLNGKTIDFKGEQGNTVEIYGTLKVIDSSEAGTGTIDNNALLHYYVFGLSSDNANLMISGGKIRNTLGIHKTSDGATVTITGGLFSVQPDSSYIAEGYECVDNTDTATKDDYPKMVRLAHTHSFTYSAEGAVITATCSDTDGKCPLTEKKVSVTLSAADAGYTGEAYTGASLDSDAWKAAGLTAPTVRYVGRAGTSYTESDTAPTAAGRYTAKITVDTDKTASVDFVIGAAVIPAGGDTAYYATLAEAVAAAEADDTVVLLSDVTVTEGITVDKTFVLDLNEKTITYAPTYTKAQYKPLFAVRNSGQEQLHFTISGEGTINGPTGDAAAKYDGKAMITVEGNSALYYEDGTLTCGGKGSDGMYGIYALNGGVLFLGTNSDGFTVTSWFAAIGTNHDTAPAVVYISNGTYTSQAEPNEGDWWHYFCTPVYAAAAGDYTIAGGTFNGYYGISTRYGDIEQTVKVEGGTFNATKSAILYDEILPSGTGAKTKTLTKTSGVTTLAAPEGYYWKEGEQDTDPLTLTARTTPDAPAAAAEGTHYTVNYKTEKLNAKTGYELAEKDGEKYTVLKTNAKVTPGGTYYVRAKETEAAYASQWVEFTAKSRPEAPAALTAADIIRTDTTVTFRNVTAGEQYIVYFETVSGGKTSYSIKQYIADENNIVDGNLTVSGIDTLTEKLGNKFCVGKAVPASDTSFASYTFSGTLIGVNLFETSLKSAPANAPEIAVTDCTLTDTTVTLPVSGTPNTYEYAIKPAEGDPVWSDTYELTGLTPATDYTYLIRVKETDDAMPSAVKELTVYTKPVTPTADSYVIDPATLIVTTTPATGYEYAVKPEGENAPVWNDIPGEGAQLAADVTYLLRVKAGGNVPASEYIEFQTKFTVDITVSGTEESGEYKWTGNAFDYANILTVTATLDDAVKTPEKGYTYSFYMANDTACETAVTPLAVGAYKVIVAVAADDPLYTGASEAFFFTILPEEVNEEGEVVTPAEHTYDKELEADVTFGSSASWETRQKVTMEYPNGDTTDLVENVHYTWTAGSIDVTLLESFLDTLEPGTYTFSIISSVPGTEDKTTSVEYVLTVDNCEYENKVSVQEGTYILKLDGVDMGKVTLAKSGSGWTLKNADGRYLVPSDGKITDSDTPFVWSYNGGFYYTQTVKQYVFLFFYRNVTQYCYMSADGISTSSVEAELFTENQSDRHSYQYRYLENERHQQYCTDCGVAFAAEDCQYGEDNLCKYCGHLDPASVQYDVAITIVKTKNPDFWTRLRYGTYCWTGMGVYAVTGDTVVKTEYSLDGVNYSVGHAHTEYKAFDTFYLRLTTATGAVSVWQYVGGQTVRVS